MPNPTDQAILQRIRRPATREEGYRQLVERYQQPLYRHLRRLVHDHFEADDLLQNTFLRAFQNMDRFRGEAALGTWLYRIATNEALGFRRRQQRRQGRRAEADDLADRLRADPYFDGDEARLALQVAIAGLPDKQRVVFNLRYFEEMPYAEMAVVLDTSVGALKASFHHARNKIEQQLRQEQMH